MSEAKRRGWSPILALAVATVVLVGLPWAFKLLTAPALGEACGGGFDCAALDGRCVGGEDGRYCTRTCEVDEDCPKAAHCGVPPHDPWLVWFSTSPMSEDVCVPGPRPAQPVEASEVMPGAKAMPKARATGPRGARGSAGAEPGRGARPKPRP
ncbi:hypothetical protein ENSA5_57030 [Enhygromyxa salina]|uniref:Uncharacterized protein n=1 Tax=Enhygromyxa salina TaxID=215803 RepID=A0A2S9XEC7_9BACT|nr:hypothetical protein [Enhygromyxa salina]PRP91228.1 hypothetical protein ENSA5_57030 [Enhygromyxa salina]